MSPAECEQVRELNPDERPFGEMQEQEAFIKEEQFHDAMMDMYTYDEGGFSDGFTKY